MIVSGESLAARPRNPQLRSPEPQRESPHGRPVGRLRVSFEIPVDHVRDLPTRGSQRQPWPTGEDEPPIDADGRDVFGSLDGPNFEFIDDQASVGRAHVDRDGPPGPLDRRIRDGGSKAGSLVERVGNRSIKPPLHAASLVGIASQKETIPQPMTIQYSRGAPGIAGHHRGGRACQASRTPENTEPQAEALGTSRCLRTQQPWPRAKAGPFLPLRRLGDSWAFRAVSRTRRFGAARFRRSGSGDGSLCPLRLCEPSSGTVNDRLSAGIRFLPGARVGSRRERAMERAADALSVTGPSR